MTRENRNRVTALGVTIVIHAIAVVLLVLMAFTTPLPLPGEAGVEVNLGMYNQGMGNIQPPKPMETTPTPPPVPEQTVKEDIMEQNVEEIPAIEEQKTETKPQQTVNQRALFKPKHTDEAPASEGTTGQPGDQGNTNGTPNANSYQGLGGDGGGTSYYLGGRGAKHLPSPEKNFSEEGKVVVDIWVDRDGNVKTAQIGKGTTTTNAAMRDMARKAALAAKFAPDKNAADLQKGTITYNFIIRQ